MSGHGDAQAITPRTDLIIAAIALVFGVAIIAASAAMPTFTDQGTPIYVAPGLVPGFHGTIIALLALVLAARSIARGALAGGWATPREGTRRTAFRIALAAILTIIFDIGLVGRLPFWLAAAIFVFVFINAFEWEPGQPTRERARNAAIALAIGLGAGIGISLLFERVFLIRMP
jgi:hypothetical protein